MEPTSFDLIHDAFWHAGVLLSRARIAKHHEQNLAKAADYARQARALWAAAKVVRAAQ